jgi:hypothetical protein
MQKRKNNMRKLAQYKVRKEEHLANIKNAFSSYSDSIRQMNTLSLEAHNKGLKRYLDFLLSPKDGEQGQELNRVKKHFDEYQKKQRVNLEKWEKDILF